MLSQQQKITLLNNTYSNRYTDKKHLNKNGFHHKNSLSTQNSDSYSTNKKFKTQENDYSNNSNDHENAKNLKYKTYNARNSYNNSILTQRNRNYDANDDIIQNNIKTDRSYNVFNSKNKSLAQIDQDIKQQYESQKSDRLKKSINNLMVKNQDYLDQYCKYDEQDENQQQQQRNIIIEQAECKIVNNQQKSQKQDLFPIKKTLKQRINMLMNNKLQTQSLQEPNNYVYNIKSNIESRVLSPKQEEIDQFSKFDKEYQEKQEQQNKIQEYQTQQKFGYDIFNKKRNSDTMQNLFNKSQIRDKMVKGSITERKSIINQQFKQMQMQKTCVSNLSNSTTIQFTPAQELIDKYLTEQAETDQNEDYQYRPAMMRTSMQFQEMKNKKRDRINKRIIKCEIKANEYDEQKIPSKIVSPKVLFQQSNQSAMFDKFSKTNSSNFNFQPKQIQHPSEIENELQNQRAHLENLQSQQQIDKIQDQMLKNQESKFLSLENDEANVKGLEELKQTQVLFNAIKKQQQQFSSLNATLGKNATISKENKVYDLSQVDDYMQGIQKQGQMMDSKGQIVTQQHIEKNRKNLQSTINIYKKSVNATQKKKQYYNQWYMDKKHWSTEKQVYNKYKHIEEIKKNQDSVYKHLHDPIQQHPLVNDINNDSILDQKKMQNIKNVIYGKSSAKSTKMFFEHKGIRVPQVLSDIETDQQQIDRYIQKFESDGQETQRLKDLHNYELKKMIDEQDIPREDISNFYNLELNNNKKNINNKGQNQQQQQIQLQKLQSRQNSKKNSMERAVKNVMNLKKLSMVLMKKPSISKVRQARLSQQNNCKQSFSNLNSNNNLQLENKNNNNYSKSLIQSQQKL